MAKDWITGRSWNTGGGGGSPFAMAAIGLLQALQNNRREDERKEEYERMMQEKKAMQEIQTGRTLMERIAQMDPALWGDQGFVDAWKAGDTTYLAKSGWKPPASTQKPEFIDKEIGGNIVRLDPITGEYKPVYQAPAKETPDKPVTLGEGGVLIDPKTGKVIYKNPKTYKPGSPDGGDTTADPNKVKYQNNFTDEKGVVWRISYNAFGDEVKRVMVGKSPKPGDGFDIEEELRKVPPKEPGTLSKLWGAAKSLFADDDEEDIAKIRSALQ